MPPMRPMPLPRSTTTLTPIQAVLQADTIKLEIPIETPAGRYWSPHRYTPSVLLARLEQVPIDDLPLGQTDIQSSVEAPTIVPTKRLGVQDYEWCDMYYASYRGAGGEEHSGLVVKVMDVSNHAVTGPGPVQKAVTYCFTRIYHAYETLAPVQGFAVPRFGSMFACGTLYCAVLEDAGRLLTYEERMDPDVQNEIINTVDAINVAGVVTVFMDWMGIYLATDGPIRIDHFSSYTSLSDLTPEFLQKRATRDKTCRGQTAEQAYAAICDWGIRRLKDFFVNGG